MAYIQFDDGTGVIDLRSLFGGNVASRFANWSPSLVSVGDRATSLATGRVIAAFIYRQEYRVSFEMRNISPNGPTANMHEVAQRFVRWCSIGGGFRVYPEDDAGNDVGGRDAYPLDTPTLTLADPRQMLYTLSITAASVAGMSWTAIYGGAR